VARRCERSTASDTYITLASSASGAACIDGCACDVEVVNGARVAIATDGRRTDDAPRHDAKETRREDANVPRTDAVRSSQPAATSAAHRAHSRDSGGARGARRVLISIDVARSSSHKVQTPRSIDTVERSIDTVDRHGFFLMFFSMSKTPACAGILCKKKERKENTTGGRRPSRVSRLVCD